MNETRLNAVPLNRVGLNTIEEIRSRAGGGGGGGDVPVEPSIPEGYETFVAFDGPFLAADGELYVKL